MQDPHRPRRLRPQDTPRRLRQPRPLHPEKRGLRVTGLSRAGFRASRALLERLPGGWRNGIRRVVRPGKAAHQTQPRRLRSRCAAHFCASRGGGAGTGATRWSGGGSGHTRSGRLRPAGYASGWPAKVRRLRQRMDARVRSRTGWTARLGEQSHPEELRPHACHPEELRLAGRRGVRRPVSGASTNAAKAGWPASGPPARGACRDEHHESLVRTASRTAGSRSAASRADRTPRSPGAERRPCPGGTPSPGRRTSAGHS